jgi:4-hydroxy-tetrahydrodipicolinate synthase
MKFEGVFTPIPTFFDGEELNDEKLATHINRLIENGVNGLVPLGTLGEFSSLTIKERKHVAEVVVSEVSGRAQVIVGTGATTTSAAIELAAHAEDIGADGVLVITPYFLKTDTEGLIKHYETLHEHIDLPIVAYNLPQFTGVELPDDVITHLADEGVISGLKDTSGNLAKILTIINNTGSDFSVLTGADALFTSTVLHGGAGGIIGSSNIFPEKTVQMYRAVKKGNIEAAVKLQMEILPIINLIGLGTFPAAVKYMIERVSGIASNVRAPLRDLNIEEKQTIDRILDPLIEAQTTGE